MLKLFKKLMLSREIQIEKGEFKLLDNIIVLNPIVENQKLIENLKEEGNENLIYHIGKTAAKEYAEKASKKHNISEKELYDWGLNTVLLSGRGKAQSIKFNEKKKEAAIEVSNNPLAERMKPKDYNVNFKLAGYIAGYCSYIFNEDIDCIETKCKANNSNKCIFKAGSNIK